MLFSNALVNAALRKLILLGLAFLGITVALFFTRETQRGDAESDAQIPCTTLAAFGKPVNTLAFSPDGKTLATGDGWLGGTGRARFWNVETGTECIFIMEYPNAIRSLAFSPNASLLAVGCYEGTVTLRDLFGGKDRHVFRYSEAFQDKAAFSPDGGKLVIWGARAHYLRLHELSTGKEQTIQGLTGPVAFCPDGQRLVAARTVGCITILNCVTGQTLLDLQGQTEVVWSVAFSPDGRTLASGSLDGTVRMWNGENGREQYALWAHQDQVNSVVFSPDGKMLASGGLDGTVKLWASPTGEELACLHGHTRSVTALAFAPDGQRLASASHDQTVRIWGPGDWRK